MARFEPPNSAVERRTVIDSILIPAWPGGWQAQLQKTGLPANSIFDLSNIEWHEGHTISKRKGFIQIADDTVEGLEAADFVLAPRVFTTTGLFPQFTQQVLHFAKSDGHLYYQSLGKLWEEHEDPTTGGDLTDSTHGLGDGSDSAINRFRVWPITAVTFGSEIYISTLRFGGFDGNTIRTDPASTGLWETQSQAEDSPSLPIVYDVEAGTFTRPAVHALDGTTGGFVRARTMVSNHARIFAGNLHSEGTYRYPSRIYWCGTDDEPDQPKLWQALNYIDVGADDGQEIVVMLAFGDQILVFKNQSIYTLVGTDDTTFALYQLDNTLGTEGTYAACAVAGKAYFLDERTGVWQYDGAEFRNLSEPIRDKLLGDLNREAAYKSVVFWHDRKVYVSIPTGTQSTATQSVTYVYDTQLETWTKWDYGFVPSPFPMYSDLEVTGPTVSLSNNMFGGTPTKGVYEFNTGLNDDGVAISSYFTTPWMNVGNVADRHRLRRLEVLADEGDDTITVDVFTDLEFDSAKTQITFNPVAGTENVLEANQTLDDYLWTWLCLRFTQNGLNEDMNLFGVGLTMSTRPSFRGTVAKTGYSA